MQKTESIQNNPEIKNKIAGFVFSKHNIKL